MSRETPHERASFPLLRPMPLRWADIDRYGHANNVVYLAWFDTAVNDTYIDHGFLATSDPHFIVARTGCTFFREVGYADRVEIGLRVARLGGTSVTYDLAVFANDEPTARAQGQYVHVLIAKETGRPTEIAGRLRTTLEGLRA